MKKIHSLKVEKPFLIIPKSLLQNSQLTALELRFVMYILDQDNDWGYSWNTVAAVLNSSSQSARNTFYDLVRKGFLVKRNNHGGYDLNLNPESVTNGLRNQPVTTVTNGLQKSVTNQLQGCNQQVTEMCNQQVTYNSTNSTINNSTINSTVKNPVFNFDKVEDCMSFIEWVGSDKIDMLKSKFQSEEMYYNFNQLVYVIPKQSNKDAVKKQLEFINNNIQH